MGPDLVLNCLSRATCKSVSRVKWVKHNVFLNFTVFIHMLKSANLLLKFGT